MHLTAVPRELFASWQDTLVHWAQRASHDTLLGLAAKHQQLAWLAARYREAARSNPHDWIARDRLKSVQRAALLTFTPVARDTTRTQARAGGMLLLALMLCTGLGLLLTDMMRQQQREPVVLRHP